MKIRKVKKSIKKLECVVFKRQALRSLKLLGYWARSSHYNAKSNIRICTKNFWNDGKFLNDGVW
jgi:hypothetical protein